VDSIATKDHRLNLNADVIVVGGGPAGIATAIATNARGLRSVVVDAQSPPIEKPCGEGLLPHGVSALRSLGIHLNSDRAVPFLGIRFADQDSSVCAKFSGGIGFGLRRIHLHQLLIERAASAGVTFLWDTRVTEIESNHVTAGGNRIRYEWLVGADGQNSRVRKWANLDARSFTGKRFGFRSHFQIRPWTDVVEVYWGKSCQIVITPTAEEEICLTVFSRNPRFRIDHALPLFPSLAERLRNNIRTTKELGNMSSMMRLPAVTRNRVALVGDAAGTVDAITGHGLSLSFHQALCLAEALEQGNLAHYEIAHRKIITIPATMTRLMLMMAGSDLIRRRTLRLFQSKPGLFSDLLSVNTGSFPSSSIGAAEIFDLGWKVLWA
jgi:2-polyprenyl-6-methoxyphenol hydroxylase-like FAD-dependent oxidoreductase